MIIKGKSKPSLGAGVHLVRVANVKYARTGSGEILHTKDGEPAIDVIFEDSNARKISMLVWFTENGQWIIDMLCVITNVDNKEREPDITEIIGKKLWIVVAEEHHMKGEDICYDSSGRPIVFPKVLPKFFKVMDLIGPRISGDPNFYGKASGIFYIEKQII